LEVEKGRTGEEEEEAAGTERKGKQEPL